MRHLMWDVQASTDEEIITMYKITDYSGSICN